MNVRSDLDQIRSTVTGWPGMTAQPHRFGGTEFNLGTTEIGHMHSNGMIDIPFNSKLRTQLLTEQAAEPHHLLPETGWISFYLREPTDVERAIWLFRLSYLFHATRRQTQAMVADALDVDAAIAALPMTPALRTAFAGVTRRES
jgi:hypothetical protein